MKIYFKNIYFILIVFISISLHAQKEANIWYFGGNAGIDFNSGSPIALTDGQLDTQEGCASIADINGNLLFYTDGSTVWDKTHNIMPNGTGLNGHWSSTNAALIIPKPNDANSYYIFTLDERGYANGLQYSEVDITLNGGLGAITTNKNILLETPVTEKITAIKVRDEDAFWVVAHKWDSIEFISYKVTSTGINTIPVVSTVGSYLGGFTINAIGAMKISPDGRKLVVANVGLWESQLFDFNDVTGEVSNPLTVLSFPTESAVYGVEFSPNSQLLYVSVPAKGVFQFNLTGSNTDIINSETQVGNLDPTLANFNKALQLGPDGKVYVATGGKLYLDVIQSPNSLGTSCNYAIDALYLNGRKVESGLPPFIQSFFYVGFQFDNVCLGDATQFTANISQVYDSLFWDFGDGNTSTDENPTHTYTTAGNYTVNLSVTVGTQTTTDTKTVTIYETPTAYQIDDQIICDTEHDGFVIYDLTLLESQILNGQDASVFSVTYYDGISNYNDGVPMEFPDMFELLTFGNADPVISVRNINNPECEDIMTFNILVLEVPEVNISVSDLITCDNTSIGTNYDGLVEIDLTTKEEEIQNWGPPTPENIIAYYLDSAHTISIPNPELYQNTNLTEIIYVNINNNTHPNSTCDSKTSFNLIISENPIATQPQNILYCDTDNDGFYTFDLSTQDADILNGQSATTFEVIYYANLADYTANTPIPDKTAYTNITAYGLQTIIASVVNISNANCEDSTSFTIQVFESPTPSLTVPDLTFCDNTSVGTDIDGIIEFDLTLRENDILNGQSSLDFTVKYYTDIAHLNEIINLMTYQNLSTSQSIYVTVENNLNTLCVEETSFVIEVFELPTVTSIVELKQCDDDTDGFSVFNLEEVIDEITTNAINETITFHEFLADATLGNSPIPNTTTYTNQTVSTDTIWARIVNGNDCVRTSQVNLIVSTTQIPLTFVTRNFYECDDAIDGTITDRISSFNFSTVTTEIEALFPVGQQLVITYYRNLADALAESNSITDITDYRNIGYPNIQNIYIRVDSLLDNDCLGLGSHITLHVEMIPIANPITLADECDDDGDGLYGFDTTNYESTIVGSQTDVTVFYTDENGAILPSPLPNPFFTVTQTITVRVENALSQDADGPCYDETTISFSVDEAAVANPVSNLIECDDDTDGFFPFDTSAIEATVLNGQTGMLVSYTDSVGNTLSSPLPNPFLTENETITVRVENPLNTICFDETTLEFIVRERPEFELIEQDVICINESPTLDITTYNPNDVYSYIWSGPNGFTDIGASTTVSEGGIYTVIATSSFGCDSFPQEISINESELATITLDMITIVDDSTNNTVTIDTANLGFGEYEFSLDNEFGDYQDSPIFNNVSAGIHIVYVRDKNDCGTTSIEISVIGFPNFFTPNNDGTNDYWNVEGINNNFYTNSIIHIYDRFGKIIANIKPTSDGWDGFYNGKELPATDYWFSVQLVSSDGNIRERRGHFSLIRR